MTADAARLARAARVLATGRAPGLAVAFAIPLVLARVFDQTEFGTYKQLFVIYATLFGVAQLGMAESLYYFVPREPGSAGRHVANAMATLAAIGLGCVAIVFVMRHQIAGWLNNPALAPFLPPLAWFLALTLTAAVFEIALIARKRPRRAAWAYALSDFCRAACFVVPAALAWGLSGVLAGAVAFAVVRLVIALVALWREFGTELRVDRGVLLRQLAYALPFAVAVGIEVLHLNWHQYAVAARFDAATFAVYAVGCLQVPVADLLVMSAVNVMMVEMAAVKDRDLASARRLWHATVGQLAFMIFPLAALLIVMARDLITVLFTSAYAGSVPIFMLWSLTMLLPVLAADGVLRVFAQTRYLLIQNVLQLALVAGLVGPFLTTFGLGGAVIATLAAALAIRIAAVIRIGRLMNLAWEDALPWRRLALAAVCAIAATAPALAMTRSVELAPAASLVLGSLVYTLTYALLYSIVAREPGVGLVRSASTTV